MANFKLPGVVCRVLGALPINTGTLCRGSSPQPGSINSHPVPIIRGRIQRLNTDSGRMQELVNHLNQREGNYTYFYCDHHGLVTIGIGHLVDRRGKPDHVGKAIARDLSREVRFTDKNTGGNVSINNVVADWLRIKNLYRTRISNGQRPGGAVTYRGTAQLRITENEAKQLSERKVENYINRLYGKHPALIQLDNYITMALVDTLFNPAGVPLFSTSKNQILRLWDALDINSSNYNLNEALRLFQAIWRNRGRARYKERHQIRVKWFRQGVKAMQAP